MKLKLLAGIVTAMMIISGFGLLTVGVVSETTPEAIPERVVMDGNAPIVSAAEPPQSIATAPIVKTYGTTPGYTPHSVQRTSLAVDYTEWACPPCASHNPLWTPAIETVGYDVVAPAYVHVWWPSAATDAVYNYCNADNSVIERVNYYGITGVPDCFLDGGDINTGQTTATYVTAFNNAAAVPSPLIIDTAGSSINGLSLDGTMNLYIEASDAIISTNLRAFVYLWETDINRPLWDPVNMIWDASPYPNGEAELDWAVWNILPAGGVGEPIFDTAGANPGDWVSLSYPLTLDTDWVVDKIGATVFVQDMATREVYQAEVELFDNLAPDVTLVTPTGAAEQVLSGDVVVEWTATDFEDDPDTGLDIEVQYSANGGQAWTTIYTGTDNNIAPFQYTWDTTSVSDGIAYMVRVKATDSLGNYRYATSAECFSVMNTPDDEWYFQLDGPFDLNINPAELTQNEIDTGDITDAGHFQLGTWETTQTFSGKSINGAWTFNVFGKTPNAGYNPLEAYLYAKIFTSSNLGTPIYTTILDNENIGAFPTSHEFTWTETLSGAIGDGDSLVVEIWVEAVGGPYPSFAGQSDNQGFDSAATPWTFHQWVMGTAGGNVVGNYQSSGGNPGGYVDIGIISDGGGQSVVEEYSGYWELPVATGFSPFSAQLSLDHACTQVGIDLATMTLYAFIDDFSGAPSRGSELWNSDVSGTYGWTGSGTIDVSAAVDSDTTYYLKLGFRHDSTNKGDGNYYVGFDNVALTFDQPSPIVYMEYDYGQTQSKVAPTIGTGSPPINYDVDTSAASAGDWIFVSFPITASGDVLTVLDDASWGNGDTTWETVCWYDTIDATDHWKTYDKAQAAAGIAQDMPNVDNAKGMWVKLTTAGTLLTVGQGYEPTSTGIALNAGWNLIGYPAVDDSAYDVLDLKTATGATKVEGYGAGPYNIITLADDYVLQRGEAYWVYVSSGSTWTVNW